MEHKKITQTMDEWNNLTSQVLDSRELELADIQYLLRKTYKILRTFLNDNTVPKEVCKLLLCMNEFLYFSSVIEDKDVPIEFFHYQAISNIVSAMQNGFFNGCFEYKFSGAQTEDMYEIDMEQDSVMEYLQAVKNKTCDKYAGIRLIG